MAPTSHHAQRTPAPRRAPLIPHLNGAITLDVSSVYNTTKNLGWLKAKVRVGNDTSANLTGVNVNGTVQGFMVSGGNEHGNSVNLLADATGSFTGQGGFTAGSIGTGAATNTALISTGSCNDSHGGGGGDDESGEHGFSHS